MTREPRHDAPAVSQDPLYDPDVATPSHAERVRTLVGAQSTGTLCTHAREPAGYPYGSFVSFALDGGTPVFLISAMAVHTKNLTVDPRCSLLVAEAFSRPPAESTGDALALGRATLVGDCKRIDDEAAAARAREVYLAQHPQAEYYVDFKDFAFWGLEVTSVRYIGGFGRMSWVAADAWRDAEPDPLATAAAGIVEHMNDDHRDALIELCLAYSRAEQVSKATMSAVDRYGYEISVETPEGPRPVRIAFDAPLSTAQQVREALIAQLQRARAGASDAGAADTDAGDGDGDGGGAAS